MNLVDSSSPHVKSVFKSTKCHNPRRNSLRQLTWMINCVAVQNEQLHLMRHLKYLIDFRLRFGWNDVGGMFSLWKRVIKAFNWFSRSYASRLSSVVPVRCRSTRDEWVIWVHIMSIRKETRVKTFLSVYLSCEVVFFTLMRLSAQELAEVTQDRQQWRGICKKCICLDHHSTDGLSVYPTSASPSVLRRNHFFTFHSPVAKVRA